MSERFVRFVLPGDMADDLKRIGDEERVSMSAPQPTSSTSEPLNAPLAGAEIILIAKVVTAVFGAGTSVLTFATKLRDLMKAKGQPVRIVSGGDSPQQRELNPNMTPDEIRRALEYV